MDSIRVLVSTFVVFSFNKATVCRLFGCMYVQEQLLHSDMQLLFTKIRAKSKDNRTERNSRFV